MNIALVFALAAATTGLAVGARAAQEDQTLDFLTRVDAAIMTEPLDRAGAERLAGRPLECTQAFQFSCDIRDVDMGGVRVRHLNFRSAKRGSLLVIELGDGVCLPVPTLKARYGPLDATMACTDGIICWYLVGRRPWGRLSFGLGEDSRADCAKSVVLDARLAKP